MRCDYVASGLVDALKATSQKMPIVARIKGFKEDKAKKILGDSVFNIVLVDDLDEAASLAIEQSSASV